MNVFIETSEDYASIGYAETLSEAENFIINDLLNRSVNIERKNLYGYPKYSTEDLGIVVDYGIENLKYVIESVFE